MNWSLFAISIASGMLLGVVYFGGLWLTLRRIAKAAWPVWSAAFSFIFRTTVVLVVFYALVLQHWIYLAVALSAFLVVRQMFIYRFGTPDKALYG